MARARTGASFGGWPDQRPQRMRRAEPPPPPPRRTTVARLPSIEPTLRELAKHAVCLCCKRRPETVRISANATDLGWRLVFFCHGSREIVPFDASGWVLRSAPPVPALNALYDKLRALFPNDAIPDMREVIEANRRGEIP